jgi:UDP-N-acetyl-D-mannosaminuronate dehydrogenase
MHEWTLLAEKIGVNLFAVVESIRVRKGTHDNMRYPGFGVGGYCLTKDSLLAQWSALNLFNTGVTLDMTLEALRVNHDMPLHTFDLLRRMARRKLKGLRVLICGVSYLPDLADTRSSPTEILRDALVQAGAVVSLHDPQVAHWPEHADVPVIADLRAALADAEAVVFAVPHREYHNRSAKWLLTAAPQLKMVVDAQNILTDFCAAALHQAGCRVSGVGKGHWRSSGYHKSP